MYFSGTIANAAGALLTTIEPHLLAAGWVLEGVQATNKKVYSSVGISGVETILLLIDDSNIAYTGFQVGTAYNDGTKVFSNPTTARYLQKASAYTTKYWLMVDLDRIIISAKCLRGGLLNYCTLYAGLPLRYNTTDKCAVIVFGSTTSASPLGLAHGSTFTGLGVQILKNYAAELDKTFGATALNANFGDGQLPNVVDGKMMISPILIGFATGEITGELKDVFSIGGASIASEDTLTKDGDTYICFFTGTYKIAILQA